MQISWVKDYLWLIPLFPAIGVIINGFFGWKMKKTTVGTIASMMVFFSFLVTLMAFLYLISLPEEERFFSTTLWTWIFTGNGGLLGTFKIPLGFQFDPLSAVMALTVSFVSFLIHVYSIGYMWHDRSFVRFFVYLNLFVFSMLILVLGNSLLLLFVGWEGVGLCSYLLISFWYEDHNNVNAGVKAFIVNRIGDFGFLLGMFLLFWTLGKQGVWTLKFTEIQEHVHLIKDVMIKLPLIGAVAAPTLIGILLYWGATGKSAQIPLYVWLPDAMAGPTPVSALIHAATMVTSGVYMIGRMNFLYGLSPTALGVVAIVSSLTAFFAATIALTQFDLKKVLAYSTVSQLGYMFIGMGVAAYTTGIFHLMTHAFFKALLFLGSGSVMHAMSDILDMRLMGGLKKKMPITFWTFLIATLAIIGTPFFSGFFSKDGILSAAFFAHNSAIPWAPKFAWFMGFITAGITAFYMFRAVFMTFYGETRAPEEIKEHIHESPPIMTVPLIILAVFSVIAGYVGVPHALGGHNLINEFLMPVWVSLKHAAEHEAPLTTEYILMALTLTLVGIGVYLAWYMYIKNPELPEKLTQKFPRLYKLLYNKYYVDEIYYATFLAGTHKLTKILRWIDVHIIDGIVNLVGWLGVRLAFLSGWIDKYIVDGIVNLVAWIFLWSGQLLRKIQVGSVQAYLYIGVGILVLVLLIQVI